MTRRTRSTGALLAIAGAVMALPGLSGADLQGPSDTPLEGPYEIGVLLDGDKVRPGPGSPSGTTVMGLDPYPGQRRICFQFEAEGLDPITGASLHKGGPDVVGPARLTLFDTPEGVPGDGYYEGCVEGVKKRLIGRIGSKRRSDAAPWEPNADWQTLVGWTWYAEIRTQAHPEGAVRGQLGAGMPCPTCFAP